MDAGCLIPKVIRGKWFSRENNVNNHIDINDKIMTDRGECVDMEERYHVNYTMVFKSFKCYYCVKIIVRTVNVIDKIESKLEIQLQSLITSLIFFMQLLASTFTHLTPTCLRFAAIWTATSKLSHYFRRIMSLWIVGRLWKASGILPIRIDLNSLESAAIRMLRFDHVKLQGRSF